MPAVRRSDQRPSRGSSGEARHARRVRRIPGTRRRQGRPPQGRTKPRGSGPQHGSSCSKSVAAPHSPPPATWPPTPAWPWSPAAPAPASAANTHPERQQAAQFLGPGDRRVPVGDQVAVPAQYGLRADQQPDAAQHVAGSRCSRNSTAGHPCAVTTLVDSSPWGFAYSTPVQDGSCRPIRYTAVAQTPMNTASVTRSTAPTPRA